MMRNAIIWAGMLSLFSVAALRAQEPPEESPVRDLTPPSLERATPVVGLGEHPEIPGNLTPTVPSHTGFYGRAEYLLGRPRSDNQDFAIRNGRGGLAITGPIESVRYNLGNGFTTELGYRFGPRGFDVDATVAYTYFAASGSTTLIADLGTALFPTITRPGLTDRAQTASADTTLNLNLYDLQLARRFLIDEHFAFRAFGGLRFAEILQSFTARYDGLDARNAAVQNNSRFNGFGPTLGGEAILAAPRGFHFYVRANGGLLVGDSTTSWLETNDGGNSVYVNAPYNVRKTVPYAGLGVGLGWQYRTVSVRFGYDVTQYFGVTDRVRLANDVAQGAVTPRATNISLDAFFAQFALTY